MLLGDWSRYNGHAIDAVNAWACSEDDKDDRLQDRLSNRDNGTAAKVGWSWRWFFKGCHL